MRRILTSVLGFALLSITVSAQTATPTNKFVFDQAGPDLATVQAYTYKQYADGATTGQTVVVTCTGATSPFTCTTPVGPFVPGPHSVVFSAANAAGESPKSAPLAFQMVVVPSAPQNPRIQ